MPGNRRTFNGVSGRISPGAASGGGAEVCFFATVEDLAVELGDMPAREVMEQQAPHLSATAVYRCPTCDRVGRLKKTWRKSIQTRRGSITLPEPEYYCAGSAAGLFSPLARTLGLASDSQLSSGLLLKVVRAGTQATSFALAARDLSVLAEVSVSSQRVRRATEGVGQERVALISQWLRLERDLELKRYTRSVLTAKRNALVRSNPYQFLPLTFLGVYWQLFCDTV